MALFVSLGCIGIFLLEILETAAIGDAYYFSESKHISNSTEACLHESPTHPLEGDSKDTKFHADGECEKVSPDYFKLTILILLTPFTIFVCKKIMMAILSKLVHFRKYPSEVKRIKSQIIILSFFYFIVSAVLHLCLYLKAKNGSQTLSLYEVFYPLIPKIFTFTNFSPASIHLYSDFSLDWYKEATFFIIIIGSTSFNISNLFKLMMGSIEFWLQKKKALKSLNSYYVKKYLHGVHLHFEAIYASCIAICFFVFLYGACIPIVVFFGFANLLVLFLVSKWIFVKYSNNPIRLGHSINQLVIKIMFVGICIHCIISPIFLFAPGIASDRENYIVTVSTGES